MRIRSYRPADADAVHRICVATGDAGEPAHRILRDPELMAYVFADPYLLLQPEMAFVVEGRDGILGYVVAALDSAEFFARWQLEWAPRFAASHPASSRPGFHDADGQLSGFLHRPRRMLPGNLDAFPSHLHINLLAGARRRGWGRGLLTTLFGELARAGSRGVQLSVRADNTAAHACYRSAGMVRLAPDGFAAVRFGRPLREWAGTVGDNGRPVHTGTG